MTENELVHYGIKGMKWGVRRYQTKSGDLTPAGKKRYADDGDTGNTSEAKSRSVNYKQNARKGAKVAVAAAATSVAAMKLSVLVGKALYNKGHQSAGLALASIGGYASTAAKLTAYGAAGYTATSAILGRVNKKNE